MEENPKGFLISRDDSTPSPTELADVELMDSEIDEEDVQINVIVRSSHNEDLSIQLHDTNLKDVNPIALIDSGAQGRFVDESIIGKGRIRKLRHAINAKNVDGTQNAAGRITHESRIRY